MQQITLTKKHLTDFSEQYTLVPDVEIGNPYNVPRTHVVPVAWLAAMANEPDGLGTKLLSAALSGWLAGQDMFIIMDEEQMVFQGLLLELFNEVVETPDA